MVSAEKRRNTVAHIRRIAEALTTPAGIIAACDQIGWQTFLGAWESAVSPSNKSWFQACFSEDAYRCFRELNRSLQAATSRHHREWELQFLVSKRFAPVASSASAFIVALNAVEHPIQQSD